MLFFQFVTSVMFVSVPESVADTSRVQLISGMARTDIC